MRRALAFAGLMMAGWGGYAAAQSSRLSPEEVARQFFKAEDDGRWLDAAHFLDLKRFESVRQTAVKTASSVRERRPVTPESMMEWEPDMPRAVAEYQAMRANKSIAEFDLLGSQFARVTSADSLAALPIHVAAARWLEARDPRWQSEQAYQRALKEPRVKCPMSGLDSAALSGAAQYKPPTAVILGAVTAGNSAAYVVVAEGFGLTPMRGLPRSQEAGVGMSPRVLVMSRVEGNWKVIPTMDIVGSNGTGGGTTVSIVCETTKPAKDSIRKN